MAPSGVKPAARIFDGDKAAIEYWLQTEALSEEWRGALSSNLEYNNTIKNAHVGEGREEGKTFWETFLVIC